MPLSRNSDGEGKMVAIMAGVHTGALPISPRRGTRSRPSIPPRNSWRFRSPPAARRRRGPDGGGVPSLEPLKVLGRRLGEEHWDIDHGLLGDVDPGVARTVPVQPLADNDEGALGTDRPLLGRLAEIGEGTDVGRLAGDGVDALVVEIGRAHV